MLFFLIQIFLISFSGAISPGAVTAACIAQGSNRSNAGALIAVGHGMIEFPLVILLTFGVSSFFETAIFQVVTGTLGGAVLLWLGIVMVRKPSDYVSTSKEGQGLGPIKTGIVLSLSNPYFFLWWATIGLGLLSESKSFGIYAFPIFFLVHWLCDLIWFSLLSRLSFAGRKIMKENTLCWLMRSCGVLMAVFGLRFLVGAMLRIL